MAHTYEVIVGNVGKVHDGDDEQAARTVFDSYARQSVHALNRVTGESVWLYRDGEIVDEYVGASARAPEEG